MKKGLTFFALALMIGFSSCSSESDEEKLEGSWVFQSIVYSDCLDPDDNEGGALSATPCTADSPEGCIYFELVVAAGGGITITGSSTSDNEVESDSTGGTYQFDGDRFTMCFDGECNTGGLSFSNGDDTVTMVFDEGDDLDGCTLTFSLRRK